MKTVIIVATTADGVIGKHSDHFANWTGKADKRVFVHVTKELGVVVFGLNTYNTFKRGLPGRRTIVYTSNPEEIQEAGIETTAEAPAELVARLEREGAAGLAVCGGSSIYTQFMEAGVVDELYITVVSRVFGTGVRLFNADMDHHLRLLSAEQLDDQAVLLHYAVSKDAPETV